MVSKMVNGHNLFLLALMLNFQLHFVTSCEDDNCSNAFDVPLISILNAPLKAELDISILTAQLKELIRHEVQASVSKANKGLVENIVDTSVKTAVDNLKTYTNITITAYKEELKETTAKTAFFTFLKRSRTFSGSDILKFDDVQINQGNSYNPNTGKFTAPRSGLYHISCSLMGSFSTASIIFQIKKNGELFLNVYAHDSGWTTQSVSLLMELMRGDKIYVKHITSRKELVNGNRQSYFSGFLLQ
ncbi:complement C1q-like protein 3 [Mytilus californianus]|uniref:complement C1q-like protein 3 n=1 Tax=Mytilus californianus TaxID=6549 RepID=UPI0022475E1C|nr:complement C1q-like protein 3 [Mytilus californianus]